MRAAAEEQILGPTGSRGEIPLTSSFRSTWVLSSIQALQRRSLLDRYCAALSEAERLALLGCGPATWLDTPLVHRHYVACDGLGLSDDAILDIAGDVTRRAHAPALALGRSVATASGVTPWTIIHKFDRLWMRVAEGGAVAVTKLGPKEARIEVLGFPLAPIRYCRVALRGIVTAMVGLFCSSVWVHEVPSLCTRSSLGYRAQWA